MFNIYNSAFDTGYPANTELSYEPVTYKTRKDFDELYLKDFSPKEKKIMRDLFTFIFNLKILDTVTDTVEYEKTPDIIPVVKKSELDSKKEKEQEKHIDKLRIAFTKLSPYDKVPCHKNKALVDGLIKAIQRRICLLKEELTKLRKLFPGPNLDIDIKTELLSNLKTFLYVLKAKNRHCILYSSNQQTIVIKEEENLDWIYYFLRRHWLLLHNANIPKVNNWKDNYFKYIRESVETSKNEAEAKAKLGAKKTHPANSRAAYEDMLKYAIQEYNNLEHIQDAENILFDSLQTGPKSINSVGIHTELVDKIFNSKAATREPDYTTHSPDILPKTQFKPLPKIGGSREPDSVEDIRDEISRALHTAQEHLKLLKPHDRERVLKTIIELFGCDTTLEEAFSFVTSKEPEWHSSMYSAIEFKLGKIKGIEPFLKAIQHVLFLKEEELESLKYIFRDVEPILSDIEAGKDRLSAILRRHPSLYEVIPKDILFQSEKDLKLSLKKIEKELPKIYPYTNALLADIYSIEDGPTIRSLTESIFLHMFTSLRPLYKTKEVFDEVLHACTSECITTMEDILKHVDKKGPLPIEVSHITSLEELIHMIPNKMVHTIANLGLPLEVYVNEKVFIGPTDGKGIPIGVVFFLYLYIKFHSVLDEPSNS